MSPPACGGLAYDIDDQIGHAAPVILGYSGRKTYANRVCFYTSVNAAIRVGLKEVLERPTAAGGAQDQDE